MDFFALDVETANANRSSICQIGIARVTDGAVASVWTVLTDPSCDFDPFNTSIHGISASDVRGQILLGDALTDMLGRIPGGSTVVSHSAFDRVAIERAASGANLAAPCLRWLDSARLARLAWPAECGQSGFGLKSVCKHLKIDFLHHDAGEDARAAALVTLRAAQTLGTDIDGLHGLLARPRVHARISATGSDSGAWFGHCIVFTGTLEIPRRHAAQMAAAAGFDVQDTVNKRTTHLVIGDRDVTLYATEKSGKHLKAEKLVESGQIIHILSESDFHHLIGTSEASPV